MFSRIVFSTGFHTPDEILPGTFTGTYFYNGTLSVTDNSQLCLNNECINNWSIISGASGMGIKGYFDYDGTYLKPNLTTGSYILNINAPGIFAGSNPYDLTPSDEILDVYGDLEVYRSSSHNLSVKDVFNYKSDILSIHAGNYFSFNNSKIGFLLNENFLVNSSYFEVLYGDSFYFKNYQGKIFGINNSVGIGSTYSNTIPLSNNSLYVEGDIGIRTLNPGNELSVNGSVSIGSTYAQVSAESNSLIVENKIGINTTTPTVALDVNGVGRFAGSNPYDLTPSDGVVHVLGDVHATGELIADGADLAEKYLSDSNEEFSAGDVVVISKTQDDSIEKSTYSYQKVLGVISTKPGLVINGNEENGHLVALVGKVPTKVIVDESNPIKRGDRLVASDIKGHAKKCELINPSQSSLPIEEVIYNNQLCIDGTIGYALQQTDKTGKILIVLK